MNNNELRVIYYLSKKTYSVRGLTNKMGIAYVNQHKINNRLEDKGIIERVDNGKGKKKQIKLKLDNNIKLLEFIKKFVLSEDGGKHE